MIGVKGKRPVPELFFGAEWRAYGGSIDTWAAQRLSRSYPCSCLEGSGGLACHGALVEKTEDSFSVWGTQWNVSGAPKSLGLSR